MKRTLVIISCIFAFSLITACSSSHTQPTVSNALASQLSAKVQLNSKQDLANWNITVTPQLGVKAEYLGESNIQNVEVKSSTIGIVSTNMLQPHNFIAIAEGEKVYLGDIDVTVSWSESGKQFSGKAVFSISKLP